MAQKDVLNANNQHLLVTHDFQDSDDDLEDFLLVQDQVKEFLNNNLDLSNSSVDNSKDENSDDSILSITDTANRTSYNNKDMKTFTLSSTKTGAKADESKSDYVPVKDSNDSNTSDSSDAFDKMQTSFTYTEYIPTEEEKQKLANISIKVMHPILPQHKVEATAGTRTLTKMERDNFQKHASLKSGKFNAEEEKQIKNNWESFCKNNNWDQEKPHPFLLTKHNNNSKFLMSQSNRKTFVQCLAHKLPQRSLYSIYSKFKLMYQPHKTARYQETEDKTILNFVKAIDQTVHERDHRFAKLAHILNRTRASVWRRYRLLKKKSLNKAN